MSENKIPDELRSEHLFLLVGTNPLPDWVAAKLLLRDGGQLYLVHSGSTHEVAKRLARLVLETPEKRYPQPIYVSVDNPYQPHSVRAAIKAKIEALQSNSIGLNYTGGTKVMSVHSYRALFESNERDKIVFSYLEAPRSVMHFEPFPPQFPTGNEFPIGLSEDVLFPLDRLLKLHEEFRLATPTKKVKVQPIAEMLVNIHSLPSGQSAWRTECIKLLKTPNNPEKFKSETDLKAQKLRLSSQFAHIADALIPGGSTGSKSLDDIASEPHWSFHGAMEVAQWLDGGWLEHYVLACVAERKKDYRVHSFGRNLNPRIGRIDFEVDIAAMRGYQLHLISCYTGSRKGTCKLKLFEAFTRARQLGGDEARAALVCCYDNPRLLESEIGQLWDTKDRVKVFGRSDLKKLKDKLQVWFDTGAQ